MGWMGRLFGRKPADTPTRGGAPLDRGATAADVAHLKQFATCRRGVEAYVEPRTNATETTVVLVAADGEWTRRRVDGPAEAWRLPRSWGLPVYDAAVVGYPQRMRDWSVRRRAAGEASEAGGAGAR